MSSLITLTSSNVLQSDTFEIQRQKINKCVADIASLNTGSGWIIPGGSPIKVFQASSRNTFNSNGSYTTLGGGSWTGSVFRLGGINSGMYGLKITSPKECKAIDLSILIGQSILYQIFPFSATTQGLVSSAGASLNYAGGAPYYEDDWSGQLQLMNTGNNAAFVKSFSCVTSSYDTSSVYLAFRDGGWGDTSITVVANGYLI
jgi:hypothetical protein